MSREKRVDYKLLNSTGEVVVKKIPNKEDQNLSSQLEDQLGNLSINDMSTSQLNIDLRVIISDINDAIDENPTSECSESEITSVISKLEDYRTILRRKNMEMQATTKCHDDSLQDTINEALAGIKDYIKSAKDFRSKCRLRGEVKLNEEAVSKNRLIIFSIEYTQH